MESLPFTNNKRPGPARTVGIIVTAFSAMALFGNSMGDYKAIQQDLDDIKKAGEDV